MSLSHINDKGEANMVDTSGKEATTRIATASGKVTMKADVLSAIANGQTPKGDVLATARIAGIMGAYFVLYPRSRIVTLVPIFIFFQIVEIPAIFFLGLWFVLQFLSGVGSVATSAGRVSGGIAFWAHVAGFAAGVVGIFLMRRPERERVEWWNDR